MLSLFVLLAFVSTAYSYTPAALADQITNLPGAPSNLPFNQFGGYLTVDKDHGRALFYWFVEAETNPATAPIALWSNGGPGCSGLIGFMTEQGPFRPNNDSKTLSRNPYAWNKLANMIFIEAPAGVGFSYSNTTSDYTTGDYRTAQDNYHAILQWLAKFPQYSNNSFYITSESYGGHYMPTLAKAIVDGNAQGGNQRINFKGFAVGNPFTDPTSNNYGTFDTFWGHQLVSKSTYDNWAKYCPDRPLQCAEAEAQMETEIGDLNPYALDYPVCLDQTLKRGRMQRNWLLHHITPKEKRGRLGVLKNLKDYEPCADDYAANYLNLASVQAAIHAKPTKWTECSYKLNYNHSDSNTPMEPIYQYLINGNYGLHILVYSGDDDSVCATSGTQSWIYGLGFDVTSTWNQWKVDGQVAGYLTKFAGYNFATVHGAGHEVPTYKPKEALQLFSNFLKGTF